MRRGRLEQGRFSFTDDLTVEFVLAAFLIFYFLLKLLTSLLVVQQAVKNWGNVMLSQRGLGGVLDLFLY